MKVINLLYEYRYGGAEKVAESYSIITSKLGYISSIFALKSSTRESDNEDVILHFSKIRYLQSIYSEIKNDNVFICHCNFALLSMIVFKLVKFSFKARCYYVQHLEYTPRKRKIIYWLVNHFLDGFIEIKSKSYCELNIIKSSKLYRIHNFSVLRLNEISEKDKINLEPIKILKKNKMRLFLFVGAVKEGKGIEHLIGIAENLKLKCNNFKIIFVGDGNGLINFKERVVSLGLEDKFIFCGYSSNPELYMQLADVLLFTSDRSEVTPMVVIEAINLRLPVIAFNLPFNRRYLGEDCLFELSDYKKIASYLINDSYHMPDIIYNESYALDRFCKLIRN